MYKIKLPKIETLTRLLQHIVQFKSLVIFIGTKGTFLVAFKNNTKVDSAFIALDDQEHLDKIKLFLSKFKSYSISLLLDNADVEFKHETIPTLESIIKTNPVEQFINEHYSENQLTSYVVYDATIDAHGESRKIIIAATNYHLQLSDIIEDLLTRSFKFNGIYFLTLEFHVIIDTILSSKGFAQCIDNVQIFVSILETVGIKIVVKHGKDIKLIKTIEYPIDKSDIYIQGIIEQEISDCLISLKSYLSKLDSSEICIIFVASDIMLNLFEQSTFENSKKLYCAHSEILQTDNIEKFSDHAITKIFAETKRYVAVNKDIKAITKLNAINSLMFKPFYAVIILLLIMVVDLKFEDFLNDYKNRQTTAKYYDLTNEYRSNRQENSLIPTEVANVMDLYNINELLKIHIPTPFEALDKFLGTLTENIEVNSVTWQLRDSDNFTKIPNQQMNVNFNYINNQGLLKEALSNLNEYIQGITYLFTDYKIQYVAPPKDKIVQIPNRRAAIPGQVIITSKPRQ